VVSSNEVPGFFMIQSHEQIGFDPVEYFDFHSG
jgi:hypothetical protein